MLKKIVAASLALSCCLFASSQSQDASYVEVLVTDTVHCMPDQFTLLLSVDPEEVYAVRGSATEATAKNLQQKLQSIRTAIKIFHIDTLENDVSLANLSRSRNTWLSLMMTSPEQLRSFIGATKGIAGLSGYVSEKKFAKSDSVRNVVAGKVLKKAAAEAAAIAVYSGKLLGGLLSVTETDMESEKSGEAGWTSYPPLAALANAGIMSTNPEMIIVRSFRVRYALK